MHPQPTGTFIPPSPKRQQKKQKTIHVTGRINPEPSSTLSKYSTETVHLTKFLESLYLTNSSANMHNNGLLNAAYAK